MLRRVGRGPGAAGVAGKRLLGVESDGELRVRVRATVEVRVRVCVRLSVKVS